MSKQIGQLSPVISLGGGDVFHVQQNGIDKRASSLVVKALAKQVAAEVPYDNANSGLVADNVKAALDETYEYLRSITGAFLLKGNIDLSTGDAALPTLAGGLTAGWMYICSVAGTITVFNPTTSMVEPTTITQGDRIYYYDTYWWLIRAERLPYDWDAVYSGNGSVSVDATYRMTINTGLGEEFNATLSKALITNNFIAVHHTYGSEGVCRLVNPYHTIAGRLGKVFAGDNLTIDAGKTLYLVKRNATVLEIVNNN